MAARPPFDIHFSFSGIHKVRVDPGHTVAAALDALRAQHPDIELPRNEDLKLTLALGAPKQIARMDVTLGDLGIKPNSTFTVTRAPLMADLESRDAISLLKRDLGALSDAAAKSPTLIFIGVGCHDKGHADDPGSVKRQQCPDALVKYCRENKTRLAVVLVDSGFDQPSKSTAPQVYDNSAWTRLTAFGPRTEYSLDNIGTLVTYATTVPEYANDLKAQGTVIANIPLLSKFAAIKESGSPSCLICGNFYPKDAKGDPISTQYFTMGSTEMIEASGIPSNPPSSSPGEGGTSVGTSGQKPSGSAD